MSPILLRLPPFASWPELTALRFIFAATGGTFSIVM